MSGAFSQKARKIRSKTYSRKTTHEMMHTFPAPPRNQLHSRKVPEKPKCSQSLRKNKTEKIKKCTDKQLKVIKRDCKHKTAETPVFKDTLIWSWHDSAGQNQNPQHKLEYLTHVIFFNHFVKQCVLVTQRLSDNCQVKSFLQKGFKKVHFV